jgi:malate dehydrogenase (oxaloacetate-decarboxylating)(NADP+)
MMDIPVFHDDQHGTAIISSAALLNALELTERDISKIRVVFAGAGAAGIACANMYVSMGVDPANVLMVDSKGVMYEGRGDTYNRYKQAYVRNTDRHSLADALDGADVFVGVSSKDLVTPEMVQSMADRPIVLAMANPDPEITYEAAKSARPDCIMATGRSDYPNQVNNVLGFPFIFRGALDVRARAINDEMKIAAAKALAALAKEDVPDQVLNAYGGERFSFGPDYIIPKPFDGFIKVLYVVAPLLGLLGTVVGMIATFQMITLFGTGDARMMAGGISTALVTTVLGLVVAIPLTLLHSFLQGKAKALIQVLEEQAAGIIARLAERPR